MSLDGPGSPDVTRAWMRPESPIVSSGEQRVCEPSGEAKKKSDRTSEQASDAVIEGKGNGQRASQREEEREREREIGKNDTYHRPSGNAAEGRMFGSDDAFQIGHIFCFGRLSDEASACDTVRHVERSHSNLGSVCNAQMGFVDVGSHCGTWRRR